MKRLLLGDCLVRMNDVKDASVDLILADLPYGTTQCRWDTIIPLDKLWAHYKRVLKPSGVVALTASQPFTSTLVMSNAKWFRHEWIWKKNRGSNFANTVREPMKEHESVLIFSAGKWTYNKQMQERAEGSASSIGKPNRIGQKAREGVGKFESFYGKSAVLSKLRVPSSVQLFNTEVGFHPTQKPVALMQYLVKTYTNEGDTVLDNTMGSGTTGVAALSLGRSFIGIEQDVAHFRTAKKRIAELNGGLFA